MASPSALLLSWIGTFGETRRMTKEMEAKIEELMAQNRRLATELESKGRIVNRALASYQQRSLQMEIVRQQNENFDRRGLAGAKHAESERARGMDASARFRNEFLANFSHDIRTPLDSIIGYCDDLMRGEGSRLTPNGRRDLGTIRVNAKTLLSLIDDILYLSKIEPDRLDVAKERVDIQGLLDECADTARELLRGKDVALEVIVWKEARHAFTDPMKLRQIVLNLLSNAAKFTNSGKIALEATAFDNELVISVEDTGIGIPREQLLFIFEKFRHVDGPRSPTLRGTGAGLATVRDLARVLGGSAHVASVPGRGSRFTVAISRSWDEMTTRSAGKEAHNEAAVGNA